MYNHLNLLNTRPEGGQGDEPPSWGVHEGAGSNSVNSHLSPCIASAFYFPMSLLPLRQLFAADV